MTLFLPLPTLIPTVILPPYPAQASFSVGGYREQKQPADLMLLLTTSLLPGRSPCYADYQTTGYSLGLCQLSSQDCSSATRRPHETPDPKEMGT